MEVALEHPPFGSARIGLVTHRAAVTLAGTPGRVELHRAGVNLIRLFSPEHGLESAALDGVAVPDGTDPQTGLPVISLYGDHKKPTPEDLDGLDGIAVDLQDVGARCYTYQSTMILAMEAAAEAGIPVWILDRPNPVGGVHVEGILRREGFESFVGQLPIPMRHGLTFAEIASWARPDGLELHPVTMRGWRRDMWWDQTGRPWAVPSPAIPDPDTTLAYLGTVLLEGTEWSEGRGTPHPFRVVAGPEDPVDFSWEDRNRFLPVAEGMLLLQRLCRRDGVRWRREGLGLDLLYGGDELRLALERDESLEPLLERDTAEAAAFGETTAAHRLYR